MKFQTYPSILIRRAVIQIIFIVVLSILLDFICFKPVFATTATYNYTGAAQTWVVPAGLTGIEVDASGAQGYNTGVVGGMGGRVQSTVSVTPGETLNIYIGGQGGVSAGGFNGNTTGTCYRGGGATDIRQSGTALANRILVAGGGGGPGAMGTTVISSGNGGAGGGTTGGAGTAATGSGGGLPGSGGTSSAGGSPGGTTVYQTGTGGCGGAGYYGGGGGGGTSAGTAGSLGTSGLGGAIGGVGAYGGGGGGGGSSYSNGTNTTHTQGYKSGNGQLIINYHTATPNIPSLDLPNDGATYQSVTPILKTTATGSEATSLKYKIQICTDVAMTQNCQTIDQTSSQTGWSGQNALTSTAYSSGTQATYTIQSALTYNTTYYWRSYAYDPIGSGGWSNPQASPRSFTTNNDSPNIPTLDIPLDGATNQSAILSLKTTASDSDLDNIKYKIQICTDVAMTQNCQTIDQTSSQTGWSGQNALTSTAYSSGTQATYTIQSALTYNTTYYWRSYAFNSIQGGLWSSTQVSPKSFTVGNSCPVYTFSYTGASQDFIVPSSRSSISIDLSGAGSGSSLGGRVQTIVSSIPGETLYVYVGGAGSVYTSVSNTGAGYNGGGGSSGAYNGTGFGGGGASDIRRGGIDLASRIVVGGGAGGRGADSGAPGTGGGGGAGGGAAGTGGGNGGAGSATTGVAGGVGGTGTGLGGALQGAGTVGTAGALGVGGTGGARAGGNGGGGNGGGGGGGYNGGGGGGGAFGGGGGGGGGSSYSNGSIVTYTSGYNSGNGQVIIYACLPPNAPTLDLPLNSATNQSLTPQFKMTSTDVESNDIQYKIFICTDVNLTQNCQLYDQTSSQTGWSSQNAQSSLAYSTGTQAVYTVQTPLTANTLYYWTAYSRDYQVATSSGTWKIQQTPRSFRTRAGSCGEPVSGNFTLSAPCTFTGTINGVDAGSGSSNSAMLTVSTGGSLTVLSDQTIAVGSFRLTGGSITIIDGGSIKTGTPLFLPDNDGDGYPTAVTSTQFFVPGAGRVRRSLSLDYDDTPITGANVYPGTVCGGTCSINSSSGTCDPKPAGENGTAACARCDGVSKTPVNITAGTQDLEGNNLCNATHFVCDGAGACSAPTTTTCVQRTLAPTGTTCTNKCAAITNGVSCVNGFTNNTCVSGTSACTNASTYCKCNIYQY